jgi:hypothetical protein
MQTCIVDVLAGPRPGGLGRFPPLKKRRSCLNPGGDLSVGVCASLCATSDGSAVAERAAVWDFTRQRSDPYLKRKTFA